MHFKNKKNYIFDKYTHKINFSKFLRPIIFLVNFGVSGKFSNKFIMLIFTV